MLCLIYSAFKVQDSFRGDSLEFRAPINFSHLFHPERIQGGSVFIIQNPSFCAEGETGVNESHKGSELSAPGDFPGEEIFIEARSA